MKPIDFPQANDLLMAAPGTEEEVLDLPVCRLIYHDQTHGTISCWQLSFWERLKVLWTGRVFLTALGRSHAPVVIEAALPKGIPKRVLALPVNLRRGKCEVPPDGWRCTRGAGHSGPCAAVPIESEGEEDRDGD